MTKSITYNYLNLPSTMTIAVNDSSGTDGKGTITNDQVWNNNNVNFDVKMGYGVSFTSAYDANGNIKRMQQWGLKIGSSDQIDDMNYSYYDKTNKLRAVTEQGSGTIDHKLGDFTDRNTGSTDYGYDKNGNLVTDLNKRITGTTGLDLTSGGAITYNYLNLPAKITVKKDDGTSLKGTITYIYDAAGNKLQKKTVDNTETVTKTTITDYVGGFIYENNELQFFGHEEGRIRPTKDSNNILSGFVYDYFLKDHLGNVRMVLTDEQKQDKYPIASLEDAKMATEQNYYAIDISQVVEKETATGIPEYVNDNGIGNNPTDEAFSALNSKKLYMLNSTTAKTGLGITLKIMAGDKIDVFGKSYYFENTTGTGNNSNVAILDLLAAFLSAPSGVGALGGHGLINPSTINTTAGIAGINTMMWQQNNQSNALPTRPRAFINLIFFDEQFKAVENGFKISMVGEADSVKDHYSELQNLIASKSGYVYIYCSNESPVDVYFDNLQVVHTRSPILEETHYYPFGLNMAGISSKAAGGLENKRKFNDGSELANKEFSDGSGLEWYETSLRSLDPQLGRWWQIDNKPDYSQSLYSAMGNNPILYNDPLGDTTVYYNASGDLLYRSSDRNKNAVTFISDKNLESFNNARGALTDLGVNMDGDLVNGVMRLFGESYDVQGMFDFFDGNRKNNPNTQTDIWKPTDGRGPLINEQSPAMENNGGVWTPNPAKTDNSPGSPFSVSLQGHGVTMHTHENEGRTFKQTWKGEIKDGIVSSGKESLGEHGDIRGAHNRPGTALFQTAVIQKSVYFYNTSGVVLSVNRDVFNPKYFKK